jgi:hypothetical protein
LENSVNNNASATVVRVARLLSLAGLVPFAFAAISAHFETWLPRAQSINVAVVYGAVILSFLGGIHWGYAVMLAQANRAKDATILFFIAVLPALAAWSSLLLTQLRDALWLLLAWFVVMLFVDWQLSRRGLVPQWFIGIRAIVTVVVVAAMLAIAIA